MSYYYRVQYAGRQHRYLVDIEDFSQDFGKRLQELHERCRTAGSLPADHTYEYQVDEMKPGEKECADC